MAPREVRFAAIAVFILAGLWLAYSSRHHRAEQLVSEPHVEEPKYDFWGIDNLRPQIEVSDIYVRTNFADYEPPLKQDVDFSIPFHALDITQQNPDLPRTPLTIQAARHETPDASSLIFGLSTQLKRLQDALPAFALWASGTSARFIILVTPQQPGEPSVEEIAQSYKDHSIPLTLIVSNDDWYDQYVSLLGVLHDHADSTTKWACIMDDDTFFFSMKRVLDMLNKYDATQPYYIGGLSENKETMDRLGYLAYGGAGVFFSMSLLQELRPHVDDCVKMPDPAGDIRVSSCIYEYSTTKFTWEHHLFQMDLHGDVTGFYEAVRTRPVSTHHWKTWHNHDMVKVGSVSKACGNECVLQKYQFQDGFIMSNGFSIFKYSYSAEEDQKHIAGAMEHTWADTAWVIPTSWIYTLAPLKPKDEGKIQFVIEKVEESEGELSLYYVRRRDGLGEGIIRMVWAKSS